MDIRINIGKDVTGPHAILVPPTFDKVSRHHATLFWRNGIATIEDNRSANGTYVNGSLVTKAQLQEDDIIWLGGFGPGCYRLDVKQILASCREAEASQYNTNVQQQVENYENVEKPQNYLGLAIVATLFNIIFGIVAIICSVRVNKLWNKGDKEGAEKASNNARRLSIAGLILGIIGIIRIFLFMY